MSKAAFLIDTNVVLEIVVVADLFAEGQRAGTPTAALQSKDYRYRQLRARHSTLLAWHLAKERIVTGSLGDEMLRVIDRQIPTMSDDAHALSAGIVNVIRPLVLRGWGFGSLTEVAGTAKGTVADTELLRLAARDGVPIVTNEGLSVGGISDYTRDTLNLRGRARAAGVAVFTPKELLDAKGVNLVEEAHRFVFACRRAVEEARRRKLLTGAGADDVLDTLEPLYRFILLDEVDPRFDSVTRAR